MNILSELAEHLDPHISFREQYGRVLAELNAFCEQELNQEQADRLNDIAGDLIHAVAAVNSREGMKLGARIVTGLLSEN